MTSSSASANPLPDWETFRSFSHAITLLGMSGIGKTWLSTRLRQRSGWFHYAADYRIGTRYLAESILDNIKAKIMRMEDDFVAKLLRSDSIYINHNITVDNLEPVSTYLGLYGDPRCGGLSKASFMDRQRRYGEGEVNAMIDVGDFIRKARRIYGCRHFINDSSGSLCEIVDLDSAADPVLKTLTECTLIVYMRADEAFEKQLRRRAEVSPKPMYYRPDFIRPRLASHPEDGEGVVPGDFARRLFAELLSDRRPRYRTFADRHGFAVDAAPLIEAMTPDGADGDVFLAFLYERLQSAVRRDADARRKVASYVGSQWRDDRRRDGRRGAD